MLPRHSHGSYEEARLAYHAASPWAMTCQSGRRRFVGITAGSDSSVPIDDHAAINILKRYKYGIQLKAVTGTRYLIQWIDSGHFPSSPGDDDFQFIGKDGVFFVYSVFFQ